MASCSAVSRCAICNASVTFLPLEAQKTLFKACTPTPRPLIYLQRNVSLIKWCGSLLLLVAIGSLKGSLVHARDAAVAAAAEPPTASLGLISSTAPSVIPVHQHIDVRSHKYFKAPARKVHPLPLQFLNVSSEQQRQDAEQTWDAPKEKAKVCWFFEWTVSLVQLLRIIRETFYSVTVHLCEHPAVWLRLLWAIINFCFALGVIIDCCNSPVDTLAKVHLERNAHCPRCCACFSNTCHADSRSDELPLLPCEKPFLWPVLRIVKTAIALHQTNWQLISQIFGRCRECVVSECCCSCSFGTPPTLHSIEDHFSSQLVIDNSSQQAAVRKQTLDASNRDFVAPDLAMVSLHDSKYVSSTPSFKCLAVRLDSSGMPIQGTNTLKNEGDSDDIAALMRSYRGQKGLCMWALFFSIAGLITLQAAFFAFQGKHIAANLLIDYFFGESDIPASSGNRLPSMSNFGAQGAMLLLLEFLLGLCMVERLFATLPSQPSRSKRGTSDGGGYRLACALTFLTLCFFGGLAAALSRPHMSLETRNSVKESPSLQTYLPEETHRLRNSYVEFVARERIVRNSTDEIMQREERREEGAQRAYAKQKDGRKLGPYGDPQTFASYIRDSASAGHNKEYTGSDTLKSSSSSMLLQPCGAPLKQLLRGSLLVPFLALRLIAFILLIRLVGNDNTLLQQRDSCRPHELHWLVSCVKAVVVPNIARS